MQAEVISNPADKRLTKTYYLRTTPVRQVLTPLTRLIFWLLADLEISGQANQPANGPYVLAANHMTNFDVFPVQYAINHPIFFIGKEELFRQPLMDWLLRQLGGFPVYRGEHDEWALNHAAQVLAHGQILGIFPEGKRNRGGGLHPAKTGAARLAHAMHCPILPVAVHGTGRILKHFPQRARVKIHIGRPIEPHPDESTLALTDRLMFTLASMLPYEERGVYTKQPKGF